MRSIALFSGFCYTQFADTYQEANGLLYADRTPKIPMDVIAEATRGTPGSVASPSTIQNSLPFLDRGEPPPNVAEDPETGVDEGSE